MLLYVISDEVDDIEVLTSCKKPTQCGTLKSELYNIELYIPTQQSIDVRILPAFELCGQLTSDGSILLPPIVQCAGDIDISKGPLLLSFKSYKHGSGTPSIWYCNDHAAEWQLHDSTSTQQSHDTRYSRVVTAKINHFTQFALGVKPSLNDPYLEAQITQIIHTADGTAPLKAVNSRHRCAQRKFIGNLTDRPMHAVARSMHHVSHQREVEANNVAVEPVINLFHQLSISLGRLFSCSRQTERHIVTKESIGDYYMVAHKSSNTTIQVPYKVPGTWVHQGDKSEAQVVFYSETKRHALSFFKRKTVDIWDVKEIRSGDVVIICPPRLAGRPANGTIKLNAAEGMSTCVQKQVRWLTATAPVPASSRAHER
jgi:hypothetical protein